MNAYRVLASPSPTSATWSTGRGQPRSSSSPQAQSRRAQRTSRTATLNLRRGLAASENFEVSTSR
jgi:hypothetical protein